MQHTPNMTLNLPDYDDTIDIQELNANFTKIDTAIYGIFEEDKSEPQIDGETD